MADALESLIDISCFYRLPTRHSFGPPVRLVFPCSVESDVSQPAALTSKASMKSEVRIVVDRNIARLHRIDGTMP